jgi:hypothetical protein
MREVLIRKFHEYLKESHPGWTDSPGGREEVEAFVRQQVLSEEPLIDELLAAEAPPFIIEEIVMESLKGSCNERSGDGL